MTAGLSRRSFLTRTGLGGATLALAGVLRATGAAATPLSVGAGPYGPLGAPDALGLRLPPGFTARVVATSLQPVPGTGHTWHYFPDGGATFATEDGGWIYVSNSEFPGSGGVSALRFAPDGTVVDAYPILANTSVNCAGGTTPWNTWLSCEEFDLHGESQSLIDQAGAIAGRVWECDPLGSGQGTPLPALGLFQHEAAVIDPDVGVVYLTEDKGDSLFYRFTPDAYPDLSSGTLEAARVDGSSITWVEVPDPSAATTRTALQLTDDQITRFRGGEGMWWHQGVVYFTTKGDNRVHALECATDNYEVIYDAADFGGANAPLRGVDNIVVADVSGDIYVAEDGGNMEIVLLSTDGVIAPFVQVVGQNSSEMTGPAFSPDGARMYFSSQRGVVAGVTYEVTGPFRGARPVAVTPPSTPSGTGAAAAPVGPAFTGGRDRIPGDIATSFRALSSPANDANVAIGALGGLTVAAAGAAAVLALRNRMQGRPADEDTAPAATD